MFFPFNKRMPEIILKCILLKNCYSRKLHLEPVPLNQRCSNLHIISHSNQTFQNCLFWFFTLSTNVPTFSFITTNSSVQSPIFCPSHAQSHKYNRQISQFWGGKKKKDKKTNIKCIIYLANRIYWHQYETDGLYFFFGWFNTH